MSASLYFNNEDQVDRTFGFVAGSSVSSPTTTGVGSQHVAITCPVPWSQVDTRLEYHESSELEAKGKPRPAHAHAHHNNGLPLQRTGSSGNCLPSVDSEHVLHVVDANIPGPCTSLLRAPSFPLPMPTPSASDNVRCKQCHVEFTGAYQKGNLARHLQHKHALVEEVTYKCIFTGCDKSFARKDARLKHARKQHPGLHSKPVKRRQGNEAIVTTSLRRKKDGPPSHYRSDDRLVRTNRGSALHAPGTNARMAYAAEPSGSIPNAQRIPSAGSIAHGTWITSTSADTSCGTAVADQVWGAGDWLPTSSEPHGPETEDHAFQQPHHNLQPVGAGAVVPAYHFGGPLLQFSQHDNLSNITVHQENRPFPQYLHHPHANWNHGHLPSPATVSGYLGSMGVSTQPSSQSFDTTASSYLHRPYTGSTSMQSIDDPALHSPLASPYSNHLTSPQSVASPYATSQNIPPTQESLPEGHTQALPRSDVSTVHSSNDQVFHQHPFEWSDSQDEELGRQIWGS